MQIDFSTTTRTSLADASPGANASSAAPAATSSTDGATNAAGATGTTSTAGTSGAQGSTGATGETLGASGASSDDPAVAQLKALIDRLQKQLATIERQMGGEDADKTTDLNKLKVHRFTVRGRFRSRG